MGRGQDRVQRRVVTLASVALITLGLLALVLAPMSSADDTVLVTVAIPQLAAVGDDVTATITLTSLNHGTPATTMHVTYDSSALELTGDDALNCNSAAAGVVDCHVPEMQSSFDYGFQFHVLKNSPTTVTGTDSGASGSGTLNAPPTQFYASTPPILSGNATIGGTLSTTAGTWAPQPYDYTYSYYWNRCTPSNSFCATLIGGPTYTVTQADAGCTLTAIVQANAGSTFFAARSATTPVIQPGQDCVPGPTVPPPPPPTTTVSGGGPPTAPPYQFVDQLPTITTDGFSTVPFLSCVDRSQDCLTDTPIVAITAGSLPAGMKLNSSEIFGTPYEPGTYTFTLRATYPAQNYTPLEKQYMLVVVPARRLSTGGVPSSAILPNHSRTPGVNNPAVTQKTIKKTICVSGWTAKVRPSVSYTDTLKLKQMKQYGEKGNPTAFEEDLLIPLELGGAPRNPKNLWPEPRNESRHSDPLETALKRKVCTGKLTLAKARIRILAYKRTHG